MTMIHDIEVKCAMCNHTSSHPVLMSTNRMGFPDLDTRPPEMQRSTMNTWISECPNCGYVAADISKKGELSGDFLESEDYRTCSGIDFESELAKKFYRKYMISTELKDSQSAFYDILHCAWACDDKEDVENAKLVRKIAADLADIIRDDEEDVDTLMLIRADLLRRSGEFEKLINEYESVSFKEELYNEIIEFQIDKAKKEDDACYTVEDIKGDMP